MGSVCRKGFTLLELLTVIVILGISLMFVTPKIIQKYSDKNPIEKEYQKIISDAYKLAVQKNKAVFIKGKKGTNLLTVENTTYKLDEVSSINSAKINNKIQSGINFYIGVYPDKFIDTFEIITANGVKLVSDTISLKVKLIE